MNKVEFLDKAKKKKVLNKLEEDYGINKLNYLLIRSGKENIRIFSGNLSKDELNLLAKNVNLELIGTKLCTITEEGIRLNFDLINLPEIKSQISKNIIDLNEDEAKKWMRGEDLKIDTKTKEKFLVVKKAEDLLGIGKVYREILKNYIPKERRIK